MAVNVLSIDLLFYESNVFLFSSIKTFKSELLNLTSTCTS